jgi:hypothetical protein
MQRHTRKLGEKPHQGIERIGPDHDRRANTPGSGEGLRGALPVRNYLTDFAGYDSSRFPKFR